MKRKTTKLMALIISVLMLTALLPTVALAADVTVSTRDELQDAINNAVDGVLTTVIISNDFYIRDITIPENKNITIKSAEGEIKSLMMDFPSGSSIIVYNGGLLTLENITIDVERGPYLTTISVERNGTLVINDGTTLKVNRTVNLNTGEIVRVHGTLIMKGGSIVDSATTAIYVQAGDFIMYGGIISGNYEGVYMSSFATFDMYGGEIRNNNSGVYFTSECIFTKHSGIVDNNNNNNYHDWSEWQVTVPATCISSGVETRVCYNNSAHTETRPIAALGHSWGVWEVTTPATCTAAGVETRFCDNNSAHTETRPIDALDHELASDGVETITPTCTAPGEKTFYCVRFDDCGYLETEAIDPLGHDFDYTAGVYTDPDCLNDGFWTYTCTRCDETEVAIDTDSALGHDYVLTVIGGELYIVCGRCGDTVFVGFESMSVKTSSTNLQNNTTVKLTVYGNYNGVAYELASASVKLKQNGTQTVTVGAYSVTVVVNGNNMISNIRLN